jgi:flagellar hook-basal body complex protein FliE
MAVPAIGGVGGVNLSQLAALYRQQVADGAAAQSVAGRAGAGQGAQGAQAAAAADRSASFTDAIGQGLNQVDALDRTAADQAVKAATGDLTDVHDYVIAATQAQVATELTTTVRNKALEAFNDIMRMPL